MNITIRKADVKDAPCIIKAEREIAQKPGYFCSQPSELDEKAVKQAIQSPQSIYLVVEHEGQIVGHAFLEPYTLQSLRHVADLNIAIHLGWQKKGIGTKLLKQVILWAKNSGVLEKIQLNVRAPNTVAISLYKKIGFQEEGRLKNRLKIKDSYIDDIIMSLDLRNWIETTKDPHINAGNDLNIRIQPASTKELEILDHAITDYNIPIVSQLPCAEVKMATMYEQIESCYIIMRQLRPHLTEKQTFIEQVQRQLKEGYQLAYIEVDGEARALAGFRFLEFLAWGKVLYIDDLITNSETRRHGHGGKLLKWVIEQAKKQNCDQVHLDSGPQRHDAHRLYLNHGFKIIGHHFALNFKEISH